MPPTPTAGEILFTPPVFHVWSAIAFIFGLLVGSFLNVCIYRLPLGISVNNPRRSFCYRCGSKIHWYDNIPVVSYFLLRGHDRACGAHFSARYAMVELMTGILFYWIFRAFNTPVADGFSFMSIWLMVFTALLIIGVFTDLDHWIMPERLSGWGAAAALAFSLLAGFFDKHALIAYAGPFPGIRIAGGDFLDTFIAVFAGPAAVRPEDSGVLWWEPAANCLIGAIVAPALLYLVGWFGKKLLHKEAMGLGDVELFVLIGATLGCINSIVVLVLASFLGSVVGIGLKIASRYRKDESPLKAGQWSEEDESRAQAEAEAARLAIEQEEEPEPVEPDEEMRRARDYAEGIEMEFVDLAEVEPSAEIIAKFPAELAVRHRVFPLAITKNSVRVAVRDPLNTRLVAELRKAFNVNIRFAIAGESQLREWCDRHFGPRIPEKPAPPVDNAGSEGWRRFANMARLVPAPHQLHHLPFIPWIALGALIVVLFHPQVIRVLRHIFVPFAS